MFYKEKLSTCIYINKLTEEFNSLNYIQYKEYDGSECIIFVSGDSIKITKTNKGHRIRTPFIIQEYIGKDIILYNEYLNPMPNELFRIKLVSEIKTRKPYFTASSLVIPSLYINEFIDETACILRVSINLSNEYVLKQGYIKAHLVMNKNSEIWNYPLYKKLNTLRTKTMVKFINFINYNLKNLENFHYIGTTNSTSNKYGIMIFKENNELLR